MSRSSNKSIRLEGWLQKKKTSERSSLFKSHNNRFFRIQEVKGSDHNELALCYYRNNRDTEAKGWIYLKDICDLVDDRKSFTIISPARNMPLEATTAAEHSAWVNEIIACSPQLRQQKESKYNDNSSKGTSDSFQPLNHDTLKRLENGNESKQAGGGGNLDRLFSRHAMITNDKTASFYHTSASLTNKEHHYKDKLDHMPSTEENEYEDIEEANEDEVINGLSSRSNLPNNNQNSSNNSTNSNSQHPLRQSREKEDHRKAVPLSSNGVSTTSRLHRAILKDPVDAPSSSYQQQQQGRNLKSIDSENGIEELTLSEPMAPRRGRDIRQRRDQRRQERSSFDRQSSYDDDDNDDQDDDEDDEADSRHNHINHTNHINKASDAVAVAFKARPKPSNEPPSTMAAAAAVIKKAPPPPSSAPPRRAQDALLEADHHQQTITRRSLDDFLASRSADAKESLPTTTMLESDSESSGDEAKYQVDFKAERAARYQSNLSSTEEHTTPDDRPPRHPTSRLTPNSAGSHSSGGSGVNNGNLMMNVKRMGTPPRQGANPGMRVDDRFATDNWDDGDEDGSESPSPKQIRYRNNTSNSDAKSSTRNGNGGGMRDFKSSSVNGLIADPNWLDVNFDE